MQRNEAISSSFQWEKGLKVYNSKFIIYVVVVIIIICGTAEEKAVHGKALKELVLACLRLTENPASLSHVKMIVKNIS